MNEILAQIIVAARKKEGWGNILFIVFLALLWAIGGILKATRAKKAEDQKTGEKLRGKPEGKPAEGITGLPKGPFQKIRLALEAELQKQQKVQAQQAQRKITRPQPAAQKVAPKTERFAQIPTLEPVKESKLVQPTAKVETGLQELPDYTGETVKKLKDKRIVAPSEIPQVKHLAEILSAYSDPDELKRAILHYEILGKPLSLRGPSGQIIGL